ncbi:hypothetical protein LguiA_028620 [Lonicera macranthoides]
MRLGGDDRRNRERRKSLAATKLRPGEGIGSEIELAGDSEIEDFTGGGKIELATLFGAVMENVLLMEADTIANVMKALQIYWVKRDFLVSNNQHRLQPAAATKTSPDASAASPRNDSNNSVRAGSNEEPN